MDPRSERVIDAMAEAMRDLLVEESYETVTVSAVCERASVRRTIFYRHFSGKDDLSDTSWAGCGPRSSTASTRRTRCRSTSSRVGWAARSSTRCTRCRGWRACGVAPRRGA